MTWKWQCVVFVRAAGGKNGCENRCHNIETSLKKNVQGERIYLINTCNEFQRNIYQIGRILCNESLKTLVSISIHPLAFQKKATKTLVSLAYRKRSFDDVEIFLRTIEWDNVWCTPLAIAISMYEVSLVVRDWPSPPHGCTRQGQQWPAARVVTILHKIRG